MNGPAAGAGANLALAADVVIGAKSSYLMQAFSKIGLIPDAGGSYILPRAMGMAKAMGASLFAEKIMAEDAANSGMIWEAVEDEQFETTWRARAAHLASGPTVTYGHIKSALRQSWDNSLGDQLALEAKLQKACGETHDFKEHMVRYHVSFVGDQQRASVCATVKELRHECGQRSKIRLSILVVVDSVIISTVYGGKSIQEVLYRVYILYCWHMEITSI